jgi:hypothetical protein
MSENEPLKNPSNALLESWMKSTQDFWTFIAKFTQPSPHVLSAFQEKPETALPKAWETALKNWQSLSSTIAEPGTAESVLQGINILPETFLKLAQLAWKSNLQIQKKVVERTGKIGQKTEAYNFDNIDHEMFKAWTEIYEENFKQFLMIPQLGLSRFYQERLNLFIDKLNLFHASFSEFMFLLYAPVEKSFKVMEENLEQLSKDGKIPQASKEYYQLWIKILEGHFMTLFKSPDYARALNETLSKLEDFLTAKNEVLQDLLQTMPVPTNKEMDELYKEIHTLKKRIKDIEKKNHPKQKKTVK